MLAGRAAPAGWPEDPPAGVCLASDEVLINISTF